MYFVVYHIDSARSIKTFNTSSAAKRSTTCMNRNAGAQKYAFTNDDDYHNNVVKTWRVKNLLTGEDVEVNSNTPRCCDPSSELYWSM